MIVKFQDRQDDHNATNGMNFTTGAEIIGLVEELSTRPPFFFELIGENGINLLVGIARSFGCAQYSCDDGQPSYWMAVLPLTKDKEGFVDFLMADTATPVPARFCLPFDVIKDVILHFQATGSRNPSVEWEVI